MHACLTRRRDLHAHFGPHIFDLYCIPVDSKSAKEGLKSFIEWLKAKEMPVVLFAHNAKSSDCKHNLLLTEREGRTGEYWPEVVAVRTERSEVRTKTTEGQYSPVRLKQARLVSSLLYGTCFEIARFRKQKIHILWPFPWKRSVWQNPDQERTNQNARIYPKTTLPYNNIIYSLQKRDLLNSFQSCVVGFVDTLILFKAILPQREKYSQESLVSDLLGISYSAHDSLEDVRALQRLVLYKEVNEKAIIKSSFTLNYASNSAKYCLNKAVNIHSLQAAPYCFQSYF